MTTNLNKLRVLIVAEHASARFGGEAVLPLHYYRVLRKRGIAVWLVVHERTKDELLSLYPDDEEHIRFVADTRLHRMLWGISRRLPDRIANFTLGYIMRLTSQLVQRSIIRRLIEEVGINIVHQPMPVSPKEPSLLYALGVPVVIGPMNGGMDYPSGFRQLQSKFETITLGIGRSFSNILNTIFPGKKYASVLLVANERTKLALPSCLNTVKTEILVENGVDLSLWSDEVLQKENDASMTHFVYMGRLVDWKAVHILINAFAIASKNSNIALSIIGDGDQRENLVNQTKNLGVYGNSLANGNIHFTGWKAQTDCAKYLRNSDGLVLTSLMECGGAVVLEAMAMGLPVIATNWGGPTDYIDSTCGVLVNPSDIDSFTGDIAEAMCKLADDPVMRKAMGEAGRKRIEKEFDWEIKVNKMIAIYLTELKSI